MKLEEFVQDVDFESAADKVVKYSPISMMSFMS